MRLIVIAAIALLAGCQSLPQTPPPGRGPAAAAPVFKADDTWTYAVHDGYTNLPQGTIRHTVTAVDADKVVLAIEQSGGLNVGCRSVARDGSLDRLPGNPQVLCGDGGAALGAHPGRGLAAPPAHQRLDLHLHSAISSP